MFLISWCYDVVITKNQFYTFLENMKSSIPSNAHFPVLRNLLQTRRLFDMRVSLVPMIKRRMFKRQALEHSSHEESENTYKQLCDEFAFKRRKQLAQFVVESKDMFKVHIVDTEDPYQVRLVLDDEDAFCSELLKWIPENDDCPRMSNWELPTHWEYEIKLPSQNCTSKMISEAIRTQTPFKDASADKTPLIHTTKKEEQVSEWHHDAPTYGKLLDPRENIVVLTMSQHSHVQGTMYLPLKVFTPDIHSNVGPLLPCISITCTISLPDGKTVRDMTLSCNEHFGIAVLDMYTNLFCELYAPEHLCRFVPLGYAHNVPSCYYHRSPPCAFENIMCNTLERKHYVINSPSKFVVE